MMLNATRGLEQAKPDSAAGRRSKAERNALRLSERLRRERGENFKSLSWSAPTFPFRCEPCPKDMAICLKTVESFLPRVLRWAEQEQRNVLRIGLPLCQERRSLATLAGVKSPEEIRILKVPFISPPGDPELAAFALLTGLITPQSTGLSLGYAVLLRVDGW